MMCVSRRPDDAACSADVLQSCSLMKGRSRRLASLPICPPCAWPCARGLLAPLPTLVVLWNAAQPPGHQSRSHARLQAAPGQYWSQCHRCCEWPLAGTAIRPASGLSTLDCLVFQGCRDAPCSTTPPLGPLACPQPPTPRVGPLAPLTPRPVAAPPIQRRWPAAQHQTSLPAARPWSSAALLPSFQHSRRPACGPCWV
ncbi:MAG: hypothetical protein J3K34DRAFT_401390 [Monoraphidium minutum]|nr:MAG: hypothetical protein J3K34DRAFT_401390 [Monoraphidium minutum]